MIKIAYLRIVGELSEKCEVEKFNKVYLFLPWAAQNH